jgi:hypothetical protein
VTAPTDDVDAVADYSGAAVVTFEIEAAGVPGARGGRRVTRAPESTPGVAPMIVQGPRDPP